jgi:hypothetical protein
MYPKCDFVNDVWETFDGPVYSDTKPNSIGACVESGHFDVARRLFEQLSDLNAICDLFDLDNRLQVHAQPTKQGL